MSIWSCQVIHNKFERFTVFRNLVDPTYIPDLAQATEDSAELMHGYAAWALDKIGGSRARQILETGLAHETAESARSEIDATLTVT